VTELKCFCFDEITYGQAVMHYSRYRLSATVTT